MNLCLFSCGGINFQISNLSETAKHHPTWLNTYNIVEIGLCTHDAGHVLTEKDWELAKEIDGVVEG